MAGDDGALDDLKISTTTLPKVMSINLKDYDYPVNKNLHLLTLTNKFSVLVRTVEKPQYETPFTNFLDLNLINEIKTRY